MITEAQIDAKLVELKTAHTAAVAKLLDGKPAESDVSPTFTEKQARIIRGFNRWDYGCQQKAVIELVAELADIPASVLMEANRAKGSSRPGNKPALYLAISSMFVSFKSKGGYDFDVGIDEPVLAKGSTLITSSISVVRGNYGNLGYSDPTEIQGTYVTILDDATIDRFCAVMKNQALMSGKYNDKFAKTFEL